MTNHAAAGRAREYRVRDHLLERGWVYVMRSAGSRGAADIAMAHADHGLALIQVGVPSKIKLLDRERLCGLAGLARALPIVAVVPPRREPITFTLVGLDSSSDSEVEL